jgi:hypothetical protein
MAILLFWLMMFSYCFFGRLTAAAVSSANQNVTDLADTAVIRREFTVNVIDSKRPWPEFPGTADCPQGSETD